jgi:uncharacterized protein (TIGR00369 family)
MTGFAPKDPAYADRVRASFAKQAMMTTIGASLTRVAPGEVDVELAISPGICQQHGFVHAGAVATVADTAAGYAALTLVPAGAGILTAEFKINLVSPAAGERLIARARLVKAGRVLTVAQAEVHAERSGERKLVALMTVTATAIQGRDGVSD